MSDNAYTEEDARGILETKREKRKANGAAEVTA